MEQEPKENTGRNSFYFKWIPFLLAFFFGIFGLIFTLFSYEERRDKILSAIMGFGINMLVTLYMMKTGMLPYSP